MASLGAAPLQRYCARIGLQPGSGGAPRLAPSLPSLAAIHWAQLKAIPFENLSLQLEAAGSGVSTELPAVYSKLVLSRRGGAQGWHSSPAAVRARPRVAACRAGGGASKPADGLPPFQPMQGTALNSMACCQPCCGAWGTTCWTPPPGWCR